MYKTAVSDPLEDAARRLPDGCDGAPEEIVKFDVPANHIGIKLGHSKASKEGSRVQQRGVIGQQLLCNLVEVAIDS